MTAWQFKWGPLELSWGSSKRFSKWPSYCRMCMRRDGVDPYSAESCAKASSCEHNPFGINASERPPQPSVGKRRTKKVPSVVKGSGHSGY